MPKNVGLPAQMSVAQFDKVFMATFKVAGIAMCFIGPVMIVLLFCYCGPGGRCKRKETAEQEEERLRKEYEQEVRAAAKKAKKGKAA
jgi:hypothetical protein